MKRNALLKKCPYSELFWPAFSRIRTEYREIQSILRTVFGVILVFPIRTEYGVIRIISPYSVRMQENQNNSEYGV